ncbi:hypothetical protein [Infirmifilum uzonense]|uniref:hypothetical protein n=1 Tax=Infirmifilum uzonense TaxID=1550241 RepID=UPI00168D2F3F|nr:hypothetical protein [Infirmifilum uzonense]
MCARTAGLEINAHINACLNITHKTGYSPPTPTRIGTYISHSGVVSLAKKKGKIRHQEPENNPLEE